MPRAKPTTGIVTHVACRDESEPKFLAIYRDATQDTIDFEQFSKLSLEAGDDILRLQMIETLLLAAIGIGAGVALGQWLLPSLLSLDPTTAQTLKDVRIDVGIQAAIAACAIVIAVASGGLPLWRVLRGNTLAGVANSSRRAIGSRGDQRLRQVLVGVQTAMAVVLILRSFARPMVALMIARLSGESSMLRTKDWSILILSKGKLRR